MKAVNVDDALKIVHEYGAFVFVTDSKKYSEMVDKISNLPELKPRTGKWAKTGQSYINPNRFRNYCCSECGWELDEHIRIEPHYCPNCGAKMEDLCKAESEE